MDESLVSRVKFTTKKKNPSLSEIQFCVLKLIKLFVFTLVKYSHGQKSQKSPM